MVSYKGLFIVSGWQKNNSPLMIPNMPNSANGTRSPATTTSGASMAPICDACIVHPSTAVRTTVGNSSAVYTANKLYVAAIPKIPTTPHAILTTLQ